MTVPYRTALITDEVSQDLATALALAVEFRLDAVELRNVWKLGPHEWSDDDILRIKGATEAAGLAVCGVAPPFFKCELDDAGAVREHLGILRRSCRAARALGAPVVRGFAFWRHGPLDEVMDRIVPHLAEAASIVEGEGLLLALENEYSTCNNNVRNTLRLMDAVGSPALGLLFDPGNDIHDPEGELPWPDACDMARGRIAHVHLKDPQRDPATGKIVTRPIGEGDARLREVLAFLAREGFAGHVSLETHYRRDPLPEDVARVPRGDAFSAGGYAASRECLEKWLAIHAEMAT